MARSFKEQLALMSEAERAEVLDLATEDELLEMSRDEWWFTARPEQFAPPGEWTLWLFLGGRGTGKSRSAYEWLVQRILDYPFDVAGNPTTSLVVAPSIADCENISIMGDSGLLTVLARKGIVRDVDFSMKMSPRPIITFLREDLAGVRILFIGADKGDVGRGQNLANLVLDELIKFPAPKELWLQGLLPALRTNVPGDRPRAMCATTPKPIPLLKEWVAEAKTPPEKTIGIVTSVGSTFDNKANLSESAVNALLRAYEGTSLGKQELEGVLLDDMDGPLFSYAWIDDNRARELPAFQHIVVGVDPCLTGEEDSDLMGVVVVARDNNEHMYILADESVPMTSGEAARHAWTVFNAHAADVLVIEDNLGKQWLEKVMLDTYNEMKLEGTFPEYTNAPLKRVHSNHGKKLRAEPVALRYEQGRVHHFGVFPKLEEEMVGWDPISSKVSPDRLDAMVHACRHLMEGERHKVRFFDPRKRRIQGL